MDKRTGAILNFRGAVVFAAVCLCIQMAVFAQPGKVEQANALYSESTELISLQTRTAYETAKNKYAAARKLYSESGENTGEAKSLVGLGFVSNGLGQNDESLGYYQLALDLFTRLENKYWAARTLNNMARIYDDTGDTDKALEYFQKALPMRRSAGDLNGEAVTLNSIGAVYVKLGRFRNGLEYYNSAYEVRKSPRMPDDRANSRGIAIILNNIGRAFDELGDKEKAKAYLNRSLPLRRSTNDRSGEATVLNNLGMVEFDLGNFETALKLYEEGLKIIRELEQTYREAELLNNAAVVYIKQSKPGNALTNLEKARTYYRKIGDKGGEATTLNNIALASQIKSPAKSPGLLVDALLLSRQAGEASLEAMTLNNLMIHWKDNGSAALSAFYGKQSVNKYQQIRTGIRSLNEDARRTYLASVTDTYRVLADVLIELGQFAQAKQVLNMLKAEEYFDFVRRDSNEIKNLGLRVALTEQEKALLERYKKIAERVTELSRQYETLDKKKRKGNRAGEDNKKEDLEFGEQLSGELRDANAAFRLFVEKQLVDELGREKVREIEYDRNLQSKLRRWGEGTVAIYTVLTDDRYRVVLTTPFVQVAGKHEIKSEELNKKVFEFRQALQDLTVDPRPKAKELYDILLKPIEKDLKAAGAKTLIWSLDGTLRYIPMSALSADGESYLVETYKNAVITAKTRDDLADTSVEWRAVGLGVSKATKIVSPADPDEVIEFSAIPGSVEELTSIVRDERQPDETGLLSGQRFIDEDFTLGAFENALRSESANGKPKFSVVHLASHFRLGSNWSDSFLLLGNNKVLTLEELSNSPALNFGDVELVTLSACDTAFVNNANGKEIDSLAGAIQTKSGKAVLATLWAVVDESTPLLMTEFYKLRKTNPGMTKAAAMREVQRGFVSGHLKPDAEYIKLLEDAFAVRGAGTGTQSFEFDKEKPFAHPYFWSPFILIGNWR